MLGLKHCLAVEPEKFDKMICSKISAWEKIRGHKSEQTRGAKMGGEKIRTRRKTNMTR